MTFPVYIHVFGRPIHPHLVMELLGYTAGSQLYFFLRRRWRRASLGKLPLEANLWVLIGCVFGALFGSKALALLESLPDYRAQWAAAHDPAVWVGGKTIVGGLLGGWAGVEIAKKALGVTRSTGDLFVFPLILGQCLGRVGCFLTGLPDHTYGTFTALPWGVDFGDGRRHPTQLYEIVFLLLLGAALLARLRRRRRPDPDPEGRLFRLYMLGYLGFRFAIEFIKPRFHPYLGLSAIQVACLVGIACAARNLFERRGTPPSQDRYAATSGGFVPVPSPAPLTDAPAHFAIANPPRLQPRRGDRM